MKQKNKTPNKDYNTPYDDYYDEDDDDYEDDDESDSFDYDDENAGNDGLPSGIAMSANLMKALGLDTSEVDTTTDWKPPSVSGFT